MPNQPYLVSRNGHYYCRIAVPLNLVSYVGRREILQSLKTKDYAEGVSRCNVFTFAVREVFKEAHKGREAVDYYLSECLKRLAFKRDSSLGHASPKLFVISGLF